MPFAGETIPLSFQLLDGDSSKFCRAVLEEADGTPLTSSPFAMVNLGAGKYTNDTVAMPNIDYVECRYEPFDDAGFTIPDPDHLVGTDVFRLEIPDSVIVAKLDEILAKLNQLSLPGAQFNAVIVQNKISEVIVDVQQTKALIERDDIKGVIADQVVQGKVDSNEITGKVTC